MACNCMHFCDRTADKSGVVQQQSAYGAYGAGYSQQGSGVPPPSFVPYDIALRWGAELILGFLLYRVCKPAFVQYGMQLCCQLVPTMSYVWPHV